MKTYFDHEKLNAYQLSLGFQRLGLLKSLGYAFDTFGDRVQEDG